MEVQAQLRDQALQKHALLSIKQSRVASLRKKLQFLEADLENTATLEQAAFASLAKAECLQLCNTITARLPRELRDMIYQRLLPNSRERISREYFRSTMDPATKMHSYDTARWKATHYPEHFWSAQYIGATCFQELVEMYYRTSTFVFGDDEGLVERFLQTDQFGVGYVPGELVMRVEVHLSAITYDRTTCIGYMFGTVTRPEKMRAALKGLGGMKEGGSVVVHFSNQARDGKMKSEQKKVAFTVLIPELRGLRERGCNAELVLDREVRVDLEREYVVEEVANE